MKAKFKISDFIRTMFNKVKCSIANILGNHPKIGSILIPR